MLFDKLFFWFLKDNYFLVKCIDLPNCHSLYLFLFYFQINRLKHTSPFFFLFYSEKKKKKKERFYQIQNNFMYKLK